MQGQKIRQGANCWRRRTEYGREPGVFVLGQYVDISDGRVGSLHNLRENPVEPLRKSVHGLAGEEICGVGPGEIHRISVLDHRDLDVELRGHDCVLHGLDLEAGQRECRSSLLLLRECHLEYRRVGLGSRGLQNVDQPLER
ncbi:hypothetical protein BKP42_20680 [Rhodococcus erythropolis]|nr:hypothetical protein BKP42_20680 [Rhodococcus erythropolis]